MKIFLNVRLMAQFYFMCLLVLLRQVEGDVFLRWCRLTSRVHRVPYR
jgi:hypothetical protein